MKLNLLKRWKDYTTDKSTQNTQQQEEYQEEDDDEKSYKIIKSIGAGALGATKITGKVTGNVLFEVVNKLHQTTKLMTAGAAKLSDLAWAKVFRIW